MAPCLLVAGLILTAIVRLVSSAGRSSDGPAECGDATSCPRKLLQGGSVLSSRSSLSSLTAPVRYNLSKLMFWRPQKVIFGVLCFFSCRCTGFINFNRKMC
jgi:hypothetical protein